MPPVLSLTARYSSFTAISSAQKPTQYWNNDMQQRMGLYR